MKALSETMGVSRSRQYEKRHEGPKVRSRHYRRAEDDRYLALIREIIEVRSTCGYRRVTVFLNRLLTRLGEPDGQPQTGLPAHEDGKPAAAALDGAAPEGP